MTSDHWHTLIGTALMTGCGSALATSLGASPQQTALLAGLVVGVVALGQSSARRLRRRVAQIEAELARRQPVAS